MDFQRIPAGTDENAYDVYLPCDAKIYGINHSITGDYCRILINTDMGTIPYRGTLEDAFKQFSIVVPPEDVYMCCNRSK